MYYIFHVLHIEKINPNKLIKVQGRRKIQKCGAHSKYKPFLMETKGLLVRKLSLTDFRRSVFPPLF